MSDETSTEGGATEENVSAELATWREDHAAIERAIVNAKAEVAKLETAYTDHEQERPA